jgi:hypothetical protein
MVQKFADTGVVQIDISDVLGRSVFKEDVLFKENNYKLNLSRLVSGMYVASIIDHNGRRFIFKFVKE